MNVSRISSIKVKIIVVKCCVILMKGVSKQRGLVVVCRLRSLYSGNDDTM